MSLFRMDPGPCPICDAPHTICTAPHPESMTTTMLPNRDAAAAAKRAADAPAPPPVEFTSATYRRALHGRGKGTSK